MSTRDLMSSPINRAERENVGLSGNTNVLFTDWRMADEWKIKSGQTGKAVRLKATATSRFHQPLNTHAHNQSLGMLHNVQFARWTLKKRLHYPHPH